MADLSHREGISARALEFDILTAARSGEVRGATWAEIDMDAALWTVPGARMKVANEHTVPLSDSALALLRAMPREGDLVFPGAKTGRPLSDMTLTAVLRRMGCGHLTAHGFRATFSSWAHSQTAYPSDVIEMTLAHTIADKVKAAYQRDDLIAKRTRMMDEWASYCRMVVATTGKVLSMTAAKASC